MWNRKQIIFYNVKGSDPGLFLQGLCFIFSHSTQVRITIEAIGFLIFFSNFKVIGGADEEIGSKQRGRIGLTEKRFN